MTYLKIMPRRKLFKVDAEEMSAINELLPLKFSADIMRQNMDWLANVVLPRIRPTSESRVVYFTDSGHHLDRTKWVGTVKPDGRLMCPHRDPTLRKERKRCTLYKELHFLFSPSGDECPDEERLCHIRRYEPTPAELAAGHKVGETCKCSNWTHVISDTQSENMRHVRRVEGKGRLVGQDNGRACALNDAVYELRKECWALACEEQTNPSSWPHIRRTSWPDVVGRTSPSDRAEWTRNDPRWSPFDSWRKNNKSFLHLKAVEFGVSDRTINNYVRHRTFIRENNERHSFEEHLSENALDRAARRSLWRREQAIANKIFRDTIPTSLADPSHVSSLEAFLGVPEGEPSVRMTQCVARYIRRTLNAEHGVRSKLRRIYVKHENIQDVKRVLRDKVEIQTRYNVGYWVATQLGRAPPPKPHCLMNDEEKAVRRHAAKREWLQYEPANKKQRKKQRI